MIVMNIHVVKSLDIFLKVDLLDEWENTFLKQTVYF